MSEDGALIDALGGPARLAERLGYDKHQGGVQRVHNWRVRGIPPKVKLEHPELFLLAPGRLLADSASPIVSEETQS